MFNNMKVEDYSEIDKISRRLGRANIIKAYVSGLSCAAVCENEEIRFSINGYKSDLLDKCFVDQKHSYAIFKVNDDEEISRIQGKRGPPHSVMIDDSTIEKRVLVILYRSFNDICWLLDIYTMSKLPNANGQYPVIFKSFSFVKSITNINEGIIRFTVEDGSVYYVEDNRVIPEQSILISIGLLISRNGITQQDKVTSIMKLLSYSEKINIYDNCSEINRRRY